MPIWAKNFLTIDPGSFGKAAWIPGQPTLGVFTDPPAICLDVGLLTCRYVDQIYMLQALYAEFPLISEHGTCTQISNLLVHQDG